MTHLHARNVGDRVERAGSSLEGDAEVSRPGLASPRPRRHREADRYSDEKGFSQGLSPRSIVV